VYHLYQLYESKNQKKIIIVLAYPNIKIIAILLFKKMTTVILKDIRSTVKSLLESFENRIPREQATDTFKEFYELYPGLFDMIYSGSCNINQLNYVLDKYDEVRKGQESMEEASKEVGQVFYDTYVAPEIKK